MRIGKILSNLQKSADFWFLIVTSIVFFLLRFPSFFEPYWYGDEGIYEVIGFGLRHGRLLYRDVWDNKPPFLYLIYALFDGNQTWVRILSWVVGLIALWLFFLLAQKLFEKKRMIYIATGVFTLLLGLPLLEGNIANAENFMVVFSVAAALLVVKVSENTTEKIQRKDFVSLLVAGFLLGLAILTKVVAVFDIAAFAVFLLIVFYHHLKKSYKHIFLSMVALAAGIAIPLVVTVFFFVTQGALRNFVQSTLFTNVGYVNYGNKFIIPQGLLVLKLLLLSGVVSTLFFARKFLSKTYLFIYLWIAFSVFNALFSQRPYTHYMLVLVASFSLLFGLVFSTKKSGFIAGFIALCLVFFFTKNFWLYDKNFMYYQNFSDFLSGRKDVVSYQNFFDRNTPRDYAVADFLNSHSKSHDVVFVWGDSGQIYRLANTLPPGRFIVAYHITATQQTLTETAQTLRRHTPRFVVILTNASPMPYKMSQYQERYSVGNAVVYEKAF